MAAVVLLGVVCAGCSRSETAQARGREDAKPVQVAPVTQQSIHRSVEVVGTLAAMDATVLSSEADGAVTKINHDLGDRVKKGDVLIELDREKAEYNFEQQKAALGRALAQYGAPDPTHLPPIEETPDVKRAKADLVQAQQSYDRASALLKRQLVPQQTLDDAQATLQAKQAAYESALQNAKNLAAAIAAADAAMKLADRGVRDTQIRAPFDGYVEQRFVNLGQFIKASAASAVPVISVVRMDPLKVTSEIPEKMAPWIHVDEVVELHVDAYPDRTIHGKITRISPAVNTASRAFPFEAEVPNPDAALKPGTFARVHITSGKVDEIVTVPYAAIQYRYGVNRVFVVDGDKLEARELKVGERLGDRIEVMSGVTPGQRVAVTEPDKLSDGMRVTAK
jgi:multidrug efflux pump subunit AcrA (membrane-fusion protein)